jgi:hypothetical protein
MKDSKVIRVLFFSLIAIKMFRLGLEKFNLYQSWSDQGLFLTNSRSYFISSALVHFLFALIPYLLAFYWALRSAKGHVLALSSGLAVFGCDLLVDLIFWLEEIGDDGLGTMFFYGFLLVIAAILLNLANRNKIS